MSSTTRKDSNIRLNFFVHGETVDDIYYVDIDKKLPVNNLKDEIKMSGKITRNKHRSI